MRDHCDPIRRLPILFLGSLLAIGCSGSDGGSQIQNTGLVVGAATGPIYDELASAYRLSAGDGSESADDYDLVIYDGQSLTPEQIQSLPSTDSFLSAGKTLILLDPSIDDLDALVGELGGAPLVDTPAVALFKTYSGDRALQNATVVDFPAVLDEVPASASTASDGSDPTEPGVVRATTEPRLDDATMRSQAEQWRRLFEQERLESARVMEARTGMTATQFAAAEQRAASGTPEQAPSAGDDGRVPAWITSPDSIPPATASPFWTVRQFTYTKPVTFKMQSALSDSRNQGIRRDGTSALQRGLCFFLPDGSSFTLNDPPASSSATVLITHVVNRLLQQTSAGSYNHSVIARQFIRSSPTVQRADAPIGKEKVSFCRALAANPAAPLGWYCTDNAFGCNRFSEEFPLRSLLGFNAQVKSSLAWDPQSAPLLSVSTVRPLAANKVSTVTTSENQSLSINWSIQGKVEAEAIPPNVAISGPSVGGEINWGWAMSQNINVTDWETKPTSTGSTAVHDLFAAAGVNNLANLSRFGQATGNGVLSYTDLTGLQESFLEGRTETNWITTGPLLPPGPAILTAEVNVKYGEVYDRFAAVDFLDPAPLPYGALHSFTVTLPMAFDFAQPILQAPVPAEWAVAADLRLPANAQGFFLVRGTVTLDEAKDTSTTIELGAEIYNFGNSQPAPTVIRNLPTQVTIPAGELTAGFDFQARRIGNPYNVRVWAFQSRGQQVAFPMTVPAN